MSEPDWMELPLRHWKRVTERYDALRAQGVPSRYAHRLAQAGFTTVEAIREATDADLLRQRNIGPATLAVIRARYPHAAEPLPGWLAEE